MKSSIIFRLRSLGGRVQWELCKGKPEIIITKGHLADINTVQRAIHYYAGVSICQIFNYFRGKG